jgi:hypothetical protein
MYSKKAAVLAIFIVMLISNLAYANLSIPADRNPSKNPNINPSVNTTLNPNVNTELNPKLNPSLNPEINKSLNPAFNADLNPKININADPRLNPHLNPAINKSLDPKFNKSINPNFNPGNVLLRFDTSLQLSMYIVTANPDHLLFYTTANELVLFAVKNSSNGYTVFDLSDRWVEYMINDSVGFLIFSAAGDWIGIVR